MMKKAVDLTAVWAVRLIKVMLLDIARHRNWQQCSNGFTLRHQGPNVCGALGHDGQFDVNGAAMKAVQCGCVAD